MILFARLYRSFHILHKITIPDLMFTLYFFFSFSAFIHNFLFPRLYVFLSPII